jgi:hypothetical protein
MRYEWVDRNFAAGVPYGQTQVQPVDEAWFNAKLQALFDTMANQGG